MTDFIEGDDALIDTVDPVTGELKFRKMTDVPFIRTRYNYDRNLASRLSGLACSDENRAQQQFKEECDINEIVRRFGVTGQLPQIDRVPLEGDFQDVTTYQEALNALIEADATFMTLPSGIRKRFENDPAQFVAFVSDPANKEEWTKMGLGAPETPPPAPIMVKVIPDPSEAPKTPPAGSGAA